MSVFDVRDAEASDYTQRVAPLNAAIRRHRILALTRYPFPGANGPGTDDLAAADTCDRP